MTISKKWLVTVCLTVVFGISCASSMHASRTRTEVPEEQIARIAGQIEDAVAYTKSEPDIPELDVDEKTGKASDEFQPLDLIIGPNEIREKVPALAQVHADTELILSAIRGRILRRPAVYELQQKGCMGETRSGFVKTIKGDLCAGDRYERDRVAYVVLLENRDRRAIYKQLAETLGESSPDRIQKIFADQIYRKAWAGTPLETPDGTWEKK